MAAKSSAGEGLLGRRVTRRGVLGGTLAAGSAAVAYAALGNPLGILSRDSETLEADTKAIAREDVKINHLLRRTGFGVTREEYDRYQSMGLEATREELVHYTAVDDSDALRLAGEVPLDPGPRGNASGWWLVRMANTKRPLQEKMTFFWHNLLTSEMSVVRDQQAMIKQNEFFRSHALDNFPEILRGITTDPAMMVYLNIAGSDRSAPNENYARELMELFSMGEGNYTEQDVREAARAFTGWQVPRTRMGDGPLSLAAPVFQRDRFDSGQKTFLGKTGNFYPEDIIDIIASDPASARYVVGRLFSFFVYPDPSDEELDPFIKIYNASRNHRQIGAVIEAILSSDVFYSSRAYRSLVKSPVEYVVSAAKALGTQQHLLEYLAQGLYGRGGSVLGPMGQVPFDPPNVAGWPGGATWLNSTTVFARLNFVNAITGGQDEPKRPQALASAREERRAQKTGASAPADPSDFGTTGTALAHYLPLVLDDNLPDSARRVFLEYGGGAEAALSPEQLRGLAYLILGSPQFHLS